MACDKSYNKQVEKLKEEYQSVSALSAEEATKNSTPKFLERPMNDGRDVTCQKSNSSGKANEPQ